MSAKQYSITIGRQAKHDEQKITTSVKIERKTNLSKIYEYAEKLRPFIEKEMTKWKYSDADKIAVRSGNPISK